MELAGVSREEHDRLCARPELQSAGAAVQLLSNSAHAMGYAACWTCAPIVAGERLGELLEVTPPARLVALTAPHAGVVRIDRMYELARAAELYEAAGCPEAMTDAFFAETGAALRAGYAAAGVRVDDLDEMTPLLGDGRGAVLPWRPSGAGA